MRALQQLAQALGHVEHDIFFQQSLAANVPRSQPP